MITSKEEKLSVKDEWNGICQPRKSLVKAATVVDWRELLAKATEEDKKTEFTYPPEILSDDDSETENVMPPPLNLSASNSKTTCGSALDLSSLSKALDSNSRKGYTMPSYEPQFKVQNQIFKSTPLKENVNVILSAKKQEPINIEVAAKKTLFNTTEFAYQQELNYHKQVSLQSTNICQPREKDKLLANNPQELIRPIELPKGGLPPPGSSGCGNTNSYNQLNGPTTLHPHNNRFAMPEVPSRIKSSNKEIVVNGKSYQTLALLGKGGSSKVYLVLAKDNSLLAIKCVNLSNVDEKTKMDHLNEIDHLMKMQHCRHIIRIIDHQYIPSRNLLYAVMERGDTDLSRLLKDRTNSGGGIPPEMILFYWSEILLAVKSIHDNNIIHRDLKPANFLLVQGRLKLIDFGIASSIQSEQTSVFKDSQSGTPNYMSPEAWDDLGMGNELVVKIGRKTDVWSLGCILYSFLYGKTPFQEFTNPIAKFRAITNPNHAIQFPPLPGVPEMLIESCRRCLIFDKNKRASIDELLELKSQILVPRSDSRIARSDVTGGVR